MTFADIYLIVLWWASRLSVIAVFSGALHLDIPGLDHHHGHVAEITVTDRSSIWETAATFRLGLAVVGIC
jgi:hypothetical protein